MLLQPTDKCAGNVSEFLQKDYKLLHFLFRRFEVCLVFFEKFFQEYIKRKLPVPRLRAQGVRSLRFYSFSSAFAMLKYTSSVVVSTMVVIRGEAITAGSTCSFSATTGRMPPIS